jgi:hypothetical protein
VRPDDGAAGLLSVFGLVSWFSWSGAFAPEPSALSVEPLGAAPFSWRDEESGGRAFSARAELPARGVLSSGEVSAARVTTAGGVRIELAERTDVDLGALAGRSRKSTLKLLRGAVECRVPPLAPGQTFSVLTPRAEVVVHGTVFSVRTSDDPAAPTCVRVSEGRVTVHGDDGVRTLTRGQSFGCPPEPSPSAVTVAERATPEGAAALSPSPKSAPRPLDKSRVTRPEAVPPKEARAAGTLEQENGLLSRGLSSERAGFCGDASRSFSELLSRYPESPLAPEARAGLERCRRGR